MIDKFDGFELGRFKLHVHPAKEKTDPKLSMNMTNTTTAVGSSSPKETFPRDTNDSKSDGGVPHFDGTSFLSMFKTATGSNMNTGADHIGAPVPSSSQVSLHFNMRCVHKVCGLVMKE